MLDQVLGQIQFQALLTGGRELKLIQQPSRFAVTEIGKCHAYAKRGECRFHTAAQPPLRAAHAPHPGTVALDGRAVPGLRVTHVHHAPCAQVGVVFDLKPMLVLLDEVLRRTSWCGRFFIDALVDTVGT